MSVFEDIKLEWKGRTFVVPSTRVMGAILKIEDVMTLNELKVYTERGAAPLGKIASCYAALLRYAGADATDEDVYRGMFSDNGEQIAMSAIVGLMSLMVPKDVDTGPAEKGNAYAAARASSKKRTRRRSAAAG